MLKQTIALLLVLLSIAFSGSTCVPEPKPTPTPTAAAATTPTNRHLQYGCPDCPGTMLKREGYVLCHDNTKKVPSWVIYNLTPGELENCVERKDAFKADPDLQPGQRAELTDYAGSGYDRGHMVPADDMCRSREVMNESFYLSNMVPQNGSLNSGKWRSLESKTQQYCLKNGPNWVITGPIFDNKSEDGSETPPQQKIGSNSVFVPQKLYKVVFWPKDGQYKAFAFIVPNQKPLTSAEQSFASYVQKYSVSIDEIESITGLDFFSVLEDNIEQGLESSKATTEELNTFVQ